MKPTTTTFTVFLVLWLLQEAHPKKINRSRTTDDADPINEASITKGAETDAQPNTEACITQSVEQVTAGKSIQAIQTEVEVSVSGDVTVRTKSYSSPKLAGLTDICRLKSRQNVSKGARSALKIIAPNAGACSAHCTASECRHISKIQEKMRAQDNCAID
jgi:hypothetical protein